MPDDNDPRLSLTIIRPAPGEALAPAREVFQPQPEPLAPYLTLPQTFVWVRTRDLTRLAAYDWRHFESVERAVFYDYQKPEGAPGMSADSVWALLHRALVDGKIVACGEDGAPIPAGFWAFIANVVSAGKNPKARDAKIKASDVFQLWPVKDGPTVPAAAKRGSNGRDYRKDDAPLVATMRELIEAGKAQSSEDAARVVMTRAVGTKNQLSLVKRLALHYRQTFPAQS